MQETGTRINKYMSQCGYCSRREADRLIEKGEVWINGTLATMGTKVMPGVTGNGRYKALYYQHDRDDDEAICRECSQKKDRKIERPFIDLGMIKLKM